MIRFSERVLTSAQRAEVTRKYSAAPPAPWSVSDAVAHLSKEPLFRPLLVDPDRIFSYLSNTESSAPPMASGRKRKRDSQGPSLQSIQFTRLCKAVTYQQLAGAAAEAIYGRLMGMCRDPDHADLLSAPVVLAKSVEELRTVGLSGAKANYIRDIAHAVTDSPQSFASFDTESDREIAETLIKIKGIGIWSIDMFLIFTLKRPDVFPDGDLAVRNAMAAHNAAKNIAKWAPFRSGAARCLWELKDTKKTK
jgi:DNA-3-methyladenine glycosylase II